MLDAGAPQLDHNLHAAADEDWVRFYAVTGYNYSVKAIQQGANSDLQLDVYTMDTNGNLVAVETNINDSFEGEDEYEQAAIASTNVVAGFYFIRVYSADTNLWGVDSDYDIELNLPAGGSVVIVNAYDVFKASPIAGSATIYGVGALGLGANGSISFSSVAGGNKTVTVASAAGHWPAEDPKNAGQVQNLVNGRYGNPRRVFVPFLGSEPVSVTFDFASYATLQGAARDLFTGEPVATAKIEFIVSGGSYNGRVWDGYPWGATYSTPWCGRKVPDEPGRARVVPQPAPDAVRLLQSQPGGRGGEPVTWPEQQPG